MPDLVPPKLRHTLPPPRGSFSSCDYAELEVTTNFSFLRGASHPDELLYRASELGYRAIAVTDFNTLSGVVRAYEGQKEAAARGPAPKLIVGARLTFNDFPDLLVYATDRASYGRLCRLLTLGKRRAEKGSCILTLEDFLQAQEGLLAAVANRHEHPFRHPAIELQLPACRGVFDRLCNLKDALGDRLSLAICRLYGDSDTQQVSAVLALGQRLNIPPLATNAVYYHDPTRRMLQDVLTCIRHGTPIQEAGYRLFPNGERYLKAPSVMHRLFRDLPQAIRRGLEIAERCTFKLDELRYEYPKELAPEGMTPMEYLEKLAWEGAAERYGCSQSTINRQQLPPKVHALLTHELALIGQLHYEAYFLTVYDIVRFARSRGILCQGRGSAANSAVCFCLGITSVDPARIDVLFERFISAARGEPPDIDVDFEHERREEVLQYIYQKYGRERAGMTAEVISYRGRSAVREVGKALGLSLDLVDQMARRLEGWSAGTISDAQLQEIGLDPANPKIRQVVDVTAQILGFPRHLSQHVGGMVMTQGPLCEMVPIENAAMADRTVIEWDKNDIDTLGILKVDCLALGMLTAVSKCLSLVNIATKGEKTERRACNGTSEDISGLGGLAEGKGIVKAHLRDYAKDAERGAIRTYESDASGIGIGSLKHCGRSRPSEPCRLPEVPSHSTRFPGGVDDPDRDRVGTGTDAVRPDDAGPAGGDGSRPSRSDPRARAEITRRLTPSSPSSLRRFVASSLFSPLQLHTIPPEDPAVYDMICKADTIGVFQIESRAQMSMLPRLKPRKFYDLIIEVAIVRPGPIQGNMVHPYLRRRNGEEEVTYPSEALREVLHKTLGVPLFQEQAMKIAMVGAGFSAEEADQLRRAMAAWRRHGSIEKFYHRFIGGMLKNGYTQAFAEYCFMQIRGFGEYGFPESHAASFALLVYASAWLKCYYPGEFACALLNSQPMGFYAPAQLVRDARNHGVTVLPPDINQSTFDCTMEDASEIANLRSEISNSKSQLSDSLRLGFRLIKGFPKSAADVLVAARQKVGRFTSVEHLHRTTGLRRKHLKLLAEADAFTSLNLPRREALWQVMALSDEHYPLFDTDIPEFPSINNQQSTLPPMPLGQEVMTDYATTGLSLKRHPVSLIRSQLDTMHITPCAQLAELDQERWVKVVGLVLIRQRPATASGIVFETLEDETGVANIIIKPEIYERYRSAARQSALLECDGYVERNGQVIHIMAKRLIDLSHLLQALQVKSRDFH